MCVCMHGCVYACMHVFMHACACACMCVLHQHKECSPILSFLYIYMYELDYTFYINSFVKGVNSFKINVRLSKFNI